MQEYKTVGLISLRLAGICQVEYKKFRLMTSSAAPDEVEQTFLWQLLLSCWISISCIYDFIIIVFQRGLLIDYFLKAYKHYLTGNIRKALTVVVAMPNNNNHEYFM